MGFDDGGIILDRDDETYYTGQFVRGRLEFDLSNVKTFRGIYMDFKGFCKVHWTTSHSRRENDRTIHYTITHESYEEYINVTTYLVGSKSGEHQLFPGKHSFPFEFQIPPHCPSSFEASDGHVRYQVKATVDRAFKLDQHKTAVFRVLAPIDLNLNPYCREAIGMEFYQSFCCWCMSAGKSEVTVKVPASGACPGQILPIQLSCKNDSSVEITAIRFLIKEKQVFHAHSEPDTRSNDNTILEIKKGPVPGNTERNWVVELEIPDMAVPNLNGCRFIDIDYKFKVKVETPSCHEDASDERPFIIGTIPLSSTINQISPTDNTLVSTAPYPVTNQPSAINLPYPNGQSPYPNPPIGMNPPYPNSNPPYPTTTPYPNTAPYPTNGNPPFSQPSPYPADANPTSPYPAPTPYPPTSSTYPAAPPAQSPYPPAQSPYPPAQSPYPPAHSPHLPAQTPYPPNQSPYPPAQSPHPPAQSPYPPAQSPYPPNQSPYPPNPSPNPPTTYGSSPKPAFTGTTLLKTGTIGFMSHGIKDGAALPLLPPSAAVPYPGSPYATASAPEPSTPDDEGKKLTQDLPTYSTPFNPDYKEKSEQK